MVEDFRLLEAISLPHASEFIDMCLELHSQDKLFLIGESRSKMTDEADSHTDRLGRTLTIDAEKSKGALKRFFGDDKREETIDTMKARFPEYDENLFRKKVNKAMRKAGNAWDFVFMLTEGQRKMEEDISSSYGK